MNNKITFFEWKKEFELGIEVLDNHHKKLISLVNELANAMSEGSGRKVIDKILKELNDYAMYHFTTEEELMEKYKYPNLKEHQSEHNKFISDIKEFTDKKNNNDLLVTVNLLNYLRVWLKDHLTVTDQKYKNLLKEKMNK